jgi:hypothetical protein
LSDAAESVLNKDEGSPWPGHNVLLLFKHMMFQKVAEFPPKDATPRRLDYTPPADI